MLDFVNIRITIQKDFFLAAKVAHNMENIFFYYYRRYSKMIICTTSFKSKAYKCRENILQASKDNIVNLIEQNIRLL